MRILSSVLVSNRFWPFHFFVQKLHHSYHPTDQPWFWQGLNAHDAHFIE
jgi:hypothetical protein